MNILSQKLMKMPLWGDLHCILNDITAWPYIQKNDMNYIHSEGVLDAVKCC